MQRYLLKDHWAQAITAFKDEEREVFSLDGYASEQLAQDILDHIRTTRFRQWTLFVQKRGEEFEHMMAKLENRDHDPEAIKRFVNNDELWNLTIELATQ